MTEFIDGEIRGGDDPLDFPSALRAFTQMLAAEILVDLEFYLAALTGLANVFVNVYGHFGYILQRAWYQGKGLTVNALPGSLVSVTREMHSLATP